MAEEVTLDKYAPMYVALLAVLVEGYRAGLLYDHQVTLPDPTRGPRFSFLLRYYEDMFKKEPPRFSGDLYEAYFEIKEYIEKYGPRSGRPIPGECPVKQASEKLWEPMIEKMRILASMRVLPMDNETKILLTFLAGIVAGLAGYHLILYYFLRRYPLWLASFAGSFFAARGYCLGHTVSLIGAAHIQALRRGFGAPDPCPGPQDCGLSCESVNVHLPQECNHETPPR